MSGAGNFHDFHDEDETGNKNIDMGSNPGISVSIKKTENQNNNEQKNVVNQGGDDDSNYTEVISSSIMGNISSKLK